MVYNSTEETINNLPDIYQGARQVEMVITVYTEDPTNSDISEADNADILKWWFHNIHTLLKHLEDSIQITSPLFSSQSWTITYIWLMMSSSHSCSIGNGWTLQIMPITLTVVGNLNTSIG